MKKIEVQPKGSYCEKIMKINEILWCRSPVCISVLIKLQRLYTIYNSHIQIHTLHMGTWSPSITFIAFT